MANASSIEWTDATWNPVTGCTKVSPGCKHCYAERWARRLMAMKNPRFSHGFEVVLHRDIADLPLRWRRSRLVFVNSMSDLFHESVPLDFIQTIFLTMQQAHWHTFQVLTKRAERLLEVAGSLVWPENVWMGVSVESQDWAWRVDCLRQVPAAVRFLSCEPLLGPLAIDLRGIHWVILGGESGPGARPIDLDWARDIRDECQKDRVPFFLKQLGGVRDKRGKDSALLDGQLWREMPNNTTRAT